MFPKLLAGTLLTLGPLLSVAQTTPRFYAGASAVLFRYAPFEAYAETHVGPAITAGVQFSPRWALEAGVQAMRFNEQGYAATVTPFGYIAYDTATVRVTSIIVPLLARYTVTATSSPLHVDILGGLAWQHTTGRGPLYIAPNGTESRGPLNTLYALVGPQLRYALGSRFEAKLNVPIAFEIAGSTEAAFRNSLFVNPQLGVQYAFAK